MTSTRKIGAERGLREALGTEDQARTEDFIASVTEAARISADLAWLLAEPVRSHKELTRDIGRMMMRRLRKELRFHVGQLTARPDLRAAWTQLVCDVALSAFMSRMLELEASERALGADEASSLP